MNQNKHHKTDYKKWPNLIAAAFVVVSVGAALFIGWQSFQLQQSEQELLMAIENQKQNLIDLKEREKIGEKMRAAEILNKARAYRKNWSEVLNDLNLTFTDRGAVAFSSVSVDATNTVAVQATAKDILNAAGFLVLVKRSDIFNNGFISAISPTSNGPDVPPTYNFTATFDYEPIIEETKTAELTTDES